MFKRIFVITFALFLILTSVTPAMAQRSEAGEDVLRFLGQTSKNAGLTDSPDQDTDVNVIIIALIDVVIGLVGIIFFIQMIFAGIRWMTSGGNEEKIKESKQTIKNSVIGIVITFSAFILVNFIFEQLVGIAG